MQMSNTPFFFFFAISWTTNKLDQMHKNRCNNVKGALARDIKSYYISVT